MFLILKLFSFLNMDPLIIFISFLQQDFFENVIRFLEIILQESFCIPQSVVFPKKDSEKIWPPQMCFSTEKETDEKSTTNDKKSAPILYKNTFIKVKFR